MAENNQIASKLLMSVKIELGELGVLSFGMLELGELWFVEFVLGEVRFEILSQVKWAFEFGC